MTEAPKTVFDQEVAREAYPNAVQSGLRGDVSFERLEEALDAYADKIVADYRAEAAAAEAAKAEDGEEPLFRDVDQPVGLLDLGYDYQGEGQHVRALALYRKFLRATEGATSFMDKDRRGFVRENFVKTLLLMAAGGDPLLAARACEWAIRFDPAARAPYLARYRALVKLGRKEDAKASLRALPKGRLWAETLLAFAFAAALTAGAYYLAAWRLGPEWTPQRLAAAGGAAAIVWGGALYRLKTTLALLVR